MTFRDVIEEMHRKDPGVKAGALVGEDGLTVEEWHAPADECDLPALCAEIVRFFRESDRIATENGLGAAGGIYLAGERALVFVRRVTVSTINNADRLASNGAGVAPILIQDRQGLSVFAAPEAWIEGPPATVEYNTEATDREWVIWAARPERFDGGN